MADNHTHQPDCRCLKVADDFNEAFQDMLKAHRQHYAVLAQDGRAVEAPRSRRALYSAIKLYRQAETAFYRAATGSSENDTQHHDDESENQQESS